MVLGQVTPWFTGVQTDPWARYENRACAGMGLGERHVSMPCPPSSTLQLRVHVQALDHKCRLHQVCQCLQALRGTFRTIPNQGCFAVRFWRQRECK